LEEDRSFLGHAWRVLGNVLSQLGQPIQHPTGGSPQPHTAEDCFARAVQIFEATGMQRNQALAQWDWARHALAQGETARGAALWQQARQSFAQLNLPRLLAQMDVQRPDLALVNLPAP
jgi:hypothetical protein